MAGDLLVFGVSGLVMGFAGVVYHSWLMYRLSKEKVELETHHLVGCDWRKPERISLNVLRIL